MRMHPISHQHKHHDGMDITAPKIVQLNLLRMELLSHQVLGVVMEM